MLADEDAELRNLVADTLEANGVLNKIRAELRASVFLALEEQESLKKESVSNRKLDQFLSTDNGHLLASLVNEFLQFFSLDFTSAVYIPEANSEKKFHSRAALAEKLNLQLGDAPLLFQLLNKSPAKDQSKMGTSKHAWSQDAATTSPEVARHQVERRKHGPREAADRSPAFSDNSPDNSAKDSWRQDRNVVAHSDGATRLDSLKDIPPLTGTKTRSQLTTDALRSPDWNDLAAIDEKISKLGFEIPKDDYGDDFQASSSKKSGELSVSEEIEEDLSIGSFAESKEGEEATDRTVSRMSGTGYDYGEDIDI